MPIHEPSGGFYFGNVSPAPISGEGSIVTDIQPSLKTWVDGADGSDEFNLVLAIQACQNESDAPTRARALLCSGDPVSAYRVLDPASDLLPEIGATFSVYDSLLAACRASTGDDESYRWLLHNSSLIVDPRIGWYVMHLVAVVSDLRGDIDMADRAWRLLVDRYGIGTPHTLGRVVATHIAERQGEDGNAVTRRLAEASTSLEQAVHPIEADARPTIAAVDTLIGRNDTAGARLLLEFVTRRNEANPALKARLEEITPERQMRRYRSLTIGLCALAPFALLLGGAGGLLLVGGAWLFRKHVDVPGLSSSDSVAWRAAHQLQFDSKTGGPTAGRPDGAWIALAVVVGGVVGALLAAQLLSLVQGFGDWVTVGAWLGPIVLCVVIAYEASTRWSRARQQGNRLTTRREAMLREAAGIGACQCWNTSALVDESARAYAHRHLEDAPFDREAEIMSEAHGRPIRLVRCPLLGTIWLLASLTTEGSLLLLRGSSGAAEPARETEIGQYL